MLKYFERIKKKNNKLQSINDNFCSNYVICKEMLEILNNNLTNIKIDKDIKNSYYVFLNDTIYLCDRGMYKTNYMRICSVAHECIHSVQNKKLQVINFVLSNIELITFVISIILILCKYDSKLIFLNYLIISIISFIPRAILELDATLKSITLSKIYMKNKIIDNELIDLIKSYKNKMLLLSPLFVLSLLSGKIFRLFLVYIISL